MDNTIPSPLPKADLPEVVNHTAFPCQYFQSVDPDDIVFHCIVSRITYDLSQLDEGGIPQLAEIQAPLETQARFYGDLAQSSPLSESDFAPYKPRCDLLLINSEAHAPNRRAVERFAVAWHLGDWNKVWQVTGPRVMRRGLLGRWRVEDPEPVSRVPLRYELAFGGTLRATTADDQPYVRADDRNPVGTGFIDPGWQKLSATKLLRAPQIEAFQHSFTGQTHYPVVGVGPLGGAWLPRRELTGTYDEQWKQTRWPRLPLDHDYRYWNCAPADQQIPYPKGGELIRLINLTASGPLRFRLPQQAMTLLLRLNAGPMLFKPMHLDTLVLDTSNHTLACVFRAVVSDMAGVRKLEIGTWETAHG